MVQQGGGSGGGDDTGGGTYGDETRPSARPLRREE